MKRIAFFLMLALVSLVSASAMTMVEFMAKYKAAEGISDITAMAGSSLKEEGINDGTVLMGELDAAAIDAIKTDLTTIPEENQLTAVTGENGEFVAVCQNPTGRDEMINILIVTIKDNAVFIIDGVCDKSTLEQTVNDISK